MPESPPGRAKRKSAQAAEDAQLARAMQDEWMKVGHKKPRNQLTPEKDRKGRKANGVNGTKGGADLEEDEGVKHFMTRSVSGFLVADVRRGCCLCEECAARVSQELISGSGLAVLRGAFSKEVAAQARTEASRLGQEALTGDKKVRLGELGPCHQRVWALLNHGAPFTTLVTLPLIFKILSPVLGEDFALGSFSANDIGPGCPRGPAHVDYPYSMLANFPNDVIACQVIFCLDPFTKANGGTQVQLHSQKSRRHPDREETLETTVEGQPGDIIIYHSLLHHRSGRNVTGERRVGLLGQFLAKYVRPMEDQVSGVREQIRRGASKALRQLLAVDCPFPILNGGTTSAGASYHD